MRSAAYIRVSTDEQVEKGNSLKEQKERLSAYCVAMGWEQPVFFEDDGFSAKDMRRPAAQEVISRVKNHDFDVVITSKLDRMSRDLLDMLQFVKLLEEHDCNYVSASEGFDTSTAVGRMVLQLLAIFAEFERERISERVKDNMMSLARNTDKALTRPCFGYNIIDGLYIVNIEEAKAVQIMANLAEQGHGYRMIAKTLNDKGYTTKKGKPWDQVNVKRVIRNRTIAGFMVYNARKSKNGKTVMRDPKEWIIKEDHHTAIIEKNRHDKILAILDSRKPANKHADSETYLLTGLIKCGHCGRNMKGSTARVRRTTASYDYYRYICSSYTLGYGCKYHAVHRDDLEKEIIGNINRLAETSSKELKILVAPSSTAIDEVEELKNQLTKINNRIQKQIEAYTNDLISASDLKVASERAEKEREKLSSKLEKALKRKVDAGDLKENASKLLGEIMGADRVKAKVAIRKLINKIEIYDGQNIEITWHALV
ncbi:recombinase family protein [Paenibacillus medicaginis]|uniref:Recombinase family protein n=1 Tax=Paenibacillus medicaginis TaxID=1470560 RepID=A0ABV5C450_9BACL